MSENGSLERMPCQACAGNLPRRIGVKCAECGGGIVTYDNSTPAEAFLRSELEAVKAERDARYTREEVERAFVRKGYLFGDELLAALDAERGK